MKLIGHIRSQIQDIRSALDEAQKSVEYFAEQTAADEIDGSALREGMASIDS